MTSRVALWIDSQAVKFDIDADLTRSVWNIPAFSYQKSASSQAALSAVLAIKDSKTHLETVTLSAEDLRIEGHGVYSLTREQFDSLYIPHFQLKKTGFSGSLVDKNNTYTGTLSSSRLEVDFIESFITTLIAPPKRVKPSPPARPVRKSRPSRTRPTLKPGEPSEKFHSGRSDRHPLRSQRRDYYQRFSSLGRVS